MFKCTQCNQTFSDEDTARAHISDAHGDDVDQALLEFMDDAIEEVYDRIIVQID